MQTRAVHNISHVCISWNKPAVRQFMKVIQHNTETLHYLWGCVFPNASISKGPKYCWKPPITLEHREALLKWKVRWAREAQSANLLSSTMQTAFTDYQRALHVQGQKVTLVYYITSISQNKQMWAPKKKIVTRAHQYIVVQHCIHAALQVSEIFGYPAIQSADVRKLTFHCSYVRGWETACVCCGETVSPA